MDTHVNYTIVGAFVITLVTLIVLAVTWISSGLTIQHYSSYLVYMQESVSGLSVDAPVEYNGVNVGTVQSISLNHQNPRLVEIILNIQRGTPITQGTVAMLNMRGITGIAYVALKDKSTDLTPLRAEKGQRYPVIKSAPSFFTQLDKALGKLSENISRVSEVIQSVFDAQNQLSIKEILLNLRTVTNTFAESSEKMSIILNNTAQASQQLSPFLKSTTNTLHTFETQTLPVANQAIANFNTAARNLSVISSQIKRNPSILIRGTTPPKLGPGEQ